MTHFIYIIENKINDKAYIGQTKYPEERKLAHLGCYSKCPLIERAVNKYGRDNFLFSIIENLSTLEEANCREIYWIENLFTLHPHGYNLKMGGECGGSLSEETKHKISLSRKGKNKGSAHPFFGRTVPQELKDAVSSANKGRTGDKCFWYGKRGEEHSVFGTKHSEEWKEFMSERMGGEKHPLFGKRGENSPRFGQKHSEETKIKISKAKKGQPGYWTNKKRSKETIDKVIATKALRRKEREDSK